MLYGNADEEEIEEETAAATSEDDSTPVSFVQSKFRAAESTF